MRTAANFFVATIVAIALILPLLAKQAAGAKCCWDQQLKTCTLLDNCCCGSQKVDSDCCAPVYNSTCICNQHTNADLVDIFKLPMSMKTGKIDEGELAYKKKEEEEVEVKEQA